MVTSVVFVRNPDVIPPRKKEIYDYFLSCAPAGQWFPIDYKAACAATGMTKYNLSRSISLMAKYGFLETRTSPTHPFGGRDVRIVRRIDGNRLVLIEGLEQHFEEKAKKKRRLIPYAGKEYGEREVW